MLKFCLKRLAFLPLVMFGVTFLLFFCLQFLSAEMRASLSKDPRRLSQLDAVIEKYNASRCRTVLHLAQADSARDSTTRNGEDARRRGDQAFFRRRLVTLLAFFDLIVGVFFGVLSAVYRDHFIDHATRFVAITGYSLLAVRVFHR